MDIQAIGASVLKSVMLMSNISQCRYLICNSMGHASVTSLFRSLPYVSTGNFPH